MNKNLTISFIVLGVVSILSVLSYSTFTNTKKFDFSNLNKPQVVKGASTDGSSAFFVPIPSETIEISTNVSNNSKSRVLESSKTQDSLVSFYKNFFASEGFSLTNESENEGFYNLGFERGSSKTELTLTKSTDGTVLISSQEFF